MSKDVIELAEAMGCTQWQLLWQVKIPLALPTLMLGLNQTIMYGIAMVADRMTQAWSKSRQEAFGTA